MKQTVAVPAIHQQMIAMTNGVQSDDYMLSSSRTSSRSSSLPGFAILQQPSEQSRDCCTLRFDWFCVLLLRFWGWTHDYQLRIINARHTNPFNKFNKAWTFNQITWREATLSVLWPGRPQNTLTVPLRRPAIRDLESIAPSPSPTEWRIPYSRKSMMNSGDSRHNSTTSKTILIWGKGKPIQASMSQHQLRHTLPKAPLCRIPASRSQLLRVSLAVLLEFHNKDKNTRYLWLKANPRKWHRVSRGLKTLSVSLTSRTEKRLWTLSSIRDPLSLQSRNTKISNFKSQQIQHNISIGHNISLLTSSRDSRGLHQSQRSRIHKVSQKEWHSKTFQLKLSHNRKSENSQSKIHLLHSRNQCNSKSEPKTSNRQ